MILTNGTIFDEHGQFVKADVAFEAGIITQIAPSGSLNGPKALDVCGLLVAPGYVDIHTHGAVGVDFCSANATQAADVARFFGRQGVTSFLATTMALPQPKLVQILSQLSPLCGADLGGATLLGFHLEGPFLAKERCGAQNHNHFALPDNLLFDQLATASGHQIRLMSIAPELPGANLLICHARGQCAVGLGHTNATYQQAKAAIKCGANQLTHLYNAMPPLLHRDPGPIGAGAEAGVFAQLIADSYHVHPSAIKAAFALFDTGGVCLISDSMCACGLGNGTFCLGDQDVSVADGKATLSDGTLAGSTATLADCVRHAIAIGIDPKVALAAATINPAKSIGLQNQVGQIRVGLQSDLQVLNWQYVPVHVWAKGKKLV